MNTFLDMLWVEMRETLRSRMPLFTVLGLCNALRGGLPGFRFQKPPIFRTSLAWSAQRLTCWRIRRPPGRPI